MKLALYEGSGSVDVFCQSCSNAGSEVYVTVDDYTGERSSTAIMDPDDARKLAAILLQVADECDEENDDSRAWKTGPTQRRSIAWSPRPPQEDLEKWANRPLLLTVEDENGDRHVDLKSTFRYMIENQHSRKEKIIAWAEVPEPYERLDGEGE